MKADFRPALFQSQIGAPKTIKSVGLAVPAWSYRPTGHSSGQCGVWVVRMVLFTRSRDWPRRLQSRTNHILHSSDRLKMTTDIQTLLSLHSGNEVRPFSPWISSLIVHRTLLNRKPSRHSFCRRLMTRIPGSHWTKFTPSFANPALSPIWYARARLFR